MILAIDDGPQEIPVQYRLIRGVSEVATEVTFSKRHSAIVVFSPVDSLVESSFAGSAKMYRACILQSCLQ